jgi:hypothetical protein
MVDLEKLDVLRNRGIGGMRKSIRLKGKGFIFTVAREMRQSGVRLIIPSISAKAHASRSLRESQSP